MDTHLLGFPYISTTLSVAAYAALSLQMTAIDRLLSDIRALSQLLSVEVRIGGLSTLLTLSVVGVLVLNSVVVCHGLSCWCSRTERVSAKHGDGQRANHLHSISTN